jgi:hypothetical protein
MPCVIIKEFDYYQSQWSIVAAWMPYIATQIHYPNTLIMESAARPFGTLLSEFGVTIN